MDPVWTMVPFPGLCVRSVSPKPQGLKWGQPDPAKGNEVALPGRKGLDAGQAKTVDAHQRAISGKWSQTTSETLASSSALGTVSSEVVAGLGRQGWPWEAAVGQALGWALGRLIGEGCSLYP